MTSVVHGSATPCDPRQCALVGRRHAHCACGLPMESGELECSLCAMEGVHAVGHGLSVRSEEPEAWDGLSYPSRRRHRVGRPSAETYELLLAVVLRSAEPAELRLGKTSRPRCAWAADRPTESASSPVALELAHDLAGPAGEHAMEELRRDFEDTGHDAAGDGSQVGKRAELRWRR